MLFIKLHRLSWVVWEWTCQREQNSECFWGFTWGCRAPTVEGGCRGPSERSCSSWTGCLKCWLVWWYCCLGSGGRSAVCEREYVWGREKERSDRQRRGGERTEGGGWIQRVTHWKSGVGTVGQTPFAQLGLCRWAAHPWNEQCNVRFLFF